MNWAASEILQDGYAGNVTALRMLQLVGGWTTAEAAQRCLVSPETFRRWRSDRRPNPTAVRLLAIEAGYVPWRGWRGWEVHDGLLFPPGAISGGLRPGQVEGLPFLLSLTRQIRRQLAPVSSEPADVIAFSGRSEAS